MNDIGPHQKMNRIQGIVRQEDSQQTELDIIWYKPPDTNSDIRTDSDLIENVGCVSHKSDLVDSDKRESLE